jgi:hypothetical protein
LAVLSSTGDIRLSKNETGTLRSEETLCVPDPFVPYWLNGTNVSDLYHHHRKLDVGEYLAVRGLLDADAEEPKDLALMKGRFAPLISPRHTYWATFSPGLADDLALVAPIWNNGIMIDMLAICADEMDYWGAVTGYGGILGSITPNWPVRVYQTPLQWLLWDRDGVIVLRKDAYAPRHFRILADRSVERLPKQGASLSDASIIYAESLEHADELVFRVFEEPADNDQHPAFDGTSVHEDILRRTILDGQSRVGVDTDRYDLDRAVARQAVDTFVIKMKNEGMFE